MLVCGGAAAGDAAEKFVNVADDLSADDRRARLTFDRRVLAQPLRSHAGASTSTSGPYFKVR